MTGTIKTHTEQGVEVVALVGEHDRATTADLVGARLDAAMASGSPIVVDLSHAEFIDTALTGTLSSLHERLAGEGRRVALVLAPGAVARAVHAAGLNGAVPLYVTRAAAISAVGDERRAGSRRRRVSSKA